MPAFALIEHKEHTNMKPKNTICLWFDKDAHEAARFYAVTFPDSEVTAVHEAPGDYPGGKKGDVLTVDVLIRPGSRAIRTMGTTSSFDRVVGPKSVVESWPTPFRSDHTTMEAFAAMLGNQLHPSRMPRD